MKVLSIVKNRPRVGRFGWVKSNFEVQGMSRPEFNNAPIGIFGLPATVRYYDATRTSIEKGTTTRRIWFETFLAQCPDHLLSVADARFTSLTKDGIAFTDHTNSKAYNPIICARNPVYLMGDVVRKAGSDWYPVRTLKTGSYEFMKQQLIDYPLLPFNATISTRSNGGRTVTPFGQLDGADCKVLPFFKDYINWLPAQWIRELQPDEPIPSSYHP